MAAAAASPTSPPAPGTGGGGGALPRGGAADAGGNGGAAAATEMPASAPTRSLLPESEYEVSETELAKWKEMIDMGIDRYLHAHPDRFHRRVRRGIPPKFRWQVWKAKVGVKGNELAAEYRELCQVGNRFTQQIEIDICRTFPELRAFSAAEQQKLLRVLNAYAGHNPGVGYCQGMNYVAGLLLIVSDMKEEESFAVLSRLMDDELFGLSGFYRERLPLLRRYLRACEKLVAEMVPELRDHFIKEQVQPAVYLHQWFLTVFINCFPLSMVMIIWDVIICEGLPVILRIAVSILQVLKDSLLTMHFEEIIKFFKMMKTYDDEEGELNAYRIGQLLMKHTEHVQIPDKLVEYLHRDLDDDGNLDSDESWEADPNSGGWMAQWYRYFSLGAGKRRGSNCPPIGNTGGGNGAGRERTSAYAPASNSGGGGSGAWTTTSTPRQPQQPWQADPCTGADASSDVAAQGRGGARRPDAPPLGSAAAHAGGGRLGGGSGEPCEEGAPGWEFL